MVGVYAWWIVALVENAQIAGNFAILKSPRKPVRQPLRPVVVDASVPKAVYGSSVFSAVVHYITIPGNSHPKS